MQHVEEAEETGGSLSNKWTKKKGGMKPTNNVRGREVGNHCSAKFLTTVPEVGTCMEGKKEGRSADEVYVMFFYVNADRCPALI